MQIVRDVTVLVDPTDEVITLAEAKNYLRVDYDEDDDLITSLILSAQSRLEKYAGIAMTGRKLLTYAYVDNLIELPYAPTGIVEKVEYFNGVDWIEAFEDADYYILGDTYRKVVLKTYPKREYRFTYFCGYDILPTPIKNATFKMLSDLYDFRQSEALAVSVNENVMTAYQLIEPYKRINYFL